MRHDHHYDRYGERVEDDDERNDAPHRCDRGFVDRDADHPVPCLVCRPHLAPDQLAPEPRKPTPAPEVARAGIRACRAALAAAKGSRR
ncbi:hypothetical protein [Amycolatopsis sp. NPDC003861]